MMRGLSLWEPWASLMAYGIKLNETRDWKTEYSGDILICAAARPPEPMPPEIVFPDKATSHPGHALCVVNLFDCVPTRNFMRNVVEAKLPLRKITEVEWRCGNYSPGRFAWMTKNRRILPQPIPWKGKQGLWILSPQEEAQIRALIAKRGECNGCGFKISPDSDYCGECMCEEDGV